MSMHENWMREAIALAQRGMENNEGGPFGALIVRGTEIIARGNNMVTSINDPTAHAEIVAIREACRQLGTFQLHDCVIYTSCEPCPMCLGAIYWARPQSVYYACTREDAAAIGFDDDLIYREIAAIPEIRRIPMEQILRDNALQVFAAWQSKEDKTVY